MKNRLVLLAIALLANPWVSMAQLTLDSCQRTARNNYPLIIRFDLIEQSNEYTLNNINNAFLPQIDLRIIGGVIDGLPVLAPGTSESASPETKLIAIAQLNQILWDGGTTMVRKRIQEATSDIERAEIEASLYAIRDRINNLFLGILLLREQAQQLGLLQSTLDRNLERVKTATLYGTAHKTDVDEIRVKIIQTQQQIEELKHNEIAWRGMLSVMTGLPIGQDTPLDMPDIQTVPDEQPIVRPELQTFARMEHLTKMRGRLSNAALYPKIGVTGLGVFIHPSIDFGLSEMRRLLLGGLSLSWNVQGLYAHGEHKKLTEIQLSKIQNQRDIFLFNTRLELTQTEAEMKKLAALIERDRELIALIEDIRKSFEVRYENGTCTMSTLLEKIDDESRARQKFNVHSIQHTMQVLRHQYESGHENN